MDKLDEMLKDLKNYMKEELIKKEDIMEMKINIHDKRYIRVKKKKAPIIASMISVLIAAILIFTFVNNNFTDKVLNDNNNFSSPEHFNSYEGPSLSIAVIGEPPSINEKQISFGVLSLSDLNMETMKNYDAVFIMKDFLEEASDSKYADIYLKSKIPFFFIQSEKGYLPFTNKSLTYSNSSNVANESYAIGYLNGKDGHSSWEFGLYNDRENSQNIRDVYSRIFKTINALKNK